MSSVPPPVIVRPSTSDLIGLRVVLDVQHAFRGGRHAGDRGARFRRADGATVDEIELALDYATAARRFLLQLGASVLTNNPSDGILVGSYEQRARVAEAWRADVYLACHVNAGAGAARCSTA
jgi:N-acetylmuramoyl-L-alanine amidase